MGVGSIVAIVLRLVVPVSILRCPLAGLIACMVLDTFDVTMAAMWGGNLGLSPAFDYHHVDKLLDTYYLSFAFVVSLKWQDRLARRTSIVLFWHRFAGVVLFLATGWRPLLLLFPNIFEYFFFLYLLVRKFSPGFRITKAHQLVLMLLVVGLPQLFREYTFHYREMSLVEIINTFTPFEIHEPSVWHWIKGRL
ncbi:MAG: hypothetical protein AB1603_03955 [Chloroflexota bacterium]